LTHTAVTSAMTSFRCHELIPKVKNVGKRTVSRKFYLQSVWGKLAI